MERQQMPTRQGLARVTRTSIVVSTRLARVDLTMALWATGPVNADAHLLRQARST